MNQKKVTQEELDNCILQTRISGFDEPYHGKVRDVYTLRDNRLGIVASDRISAFDHIMKQAIPYKGQILNQLAAFSFDKVADIMPTHIIEVPHPNVTIAKKCDPIPIEVVIRACLTGHAWRVYKTGKRELCGVSLPEGMIENESFTTPILTPATKAESGHDEDISEEEIINQGLVDQYLWQEIREKAFKIFHRGQQLAQQQGLILVDTKYEFGIYEGELTLIDEIHTADSSRYFYEEGYAERLEQGLPQKQLSKEFLREWLMEHSFQGKKDQSLPDLPDALRRQIFDRYRELFQKLTGESFHPTPIQASSVNRDLQAIFNNFSR